MPENSSKNQITTISIGTIFNFFLVALLLFLIYYLRDIVLVVLTSIVIASFVTIVSNRLARYRINRTLGVILIYAIAITLVSALFYFFVPIIINEFSGFISHISQYLPKSSALNDFQSNALSGAKELVSGISNNLTFSGLVDSAKSGVSGASGAFFDSIAMAFV